MDRIRINPQEGGAFQNPVNEQAYKKALSLRNDAVKMSETLQAKDETVLDSSAGAGRVSVKDEMQEKSFKASLKYNPVDGKTKKMKAEVLDETIGRNMKLEAKHKKNILGSEKDVYTYKERDLVTGGTLEKKAVFHQDGLIDYSEFRTHLPGSGYRPFVGELPQ